MQLPGALALAAAGAATQANAATVQISFANNVVSMSSGLTNFSPDLTGDGVADLKAFIGSSDVRMLELDNDFLAKASTSSGTVRLGNRVAVSTSDRALIAFTFKDARINSFALTSGFLDVEGYATEGGNDAQLKIHRLIFDYSSTTAPAGVTTATTGLSEWSANAVPEPSSLGLLALGAGGLLARRRRAMVA